MSEKKKNLADKMKNVSELLDKCNEAVQTESLTLLQQLQHKDWGDFWEEIYEAEKINREAQRARGNE